ncbi:LacI family DNA-binding transcriptional regulator [Paenibacillus sp. GCM10027629]|uniref:LacI family DNA-binding transcriptional regulator n=1 Tax=Paenibacillus sp. GCM10027629 TaxID=3273414 RepID=UPI003637A5EF
MKKTTIKDIAKAADVSIATVSYILNDVKTQSISDETRVKVLKVAQQLKYVANRSAQSLKIKKTGLMGILLFKDTHQSPGSALKYAKTIYKLEELCSNLGYHVIFMQLDSASLSYKVIMERNLDGVFLINADREKFYAISNQFGFGIPVFVIDSYIEDSLFHKIMPNFGQSFAAAQTLLGQAPEFLVMDAYNNTELREVIKQQSGLDEDRIYVYENREGMQAFLSKFAGKPGIVINEFLANEAWKAHKNLVACCTSHCEELFPDDMMKISFNLNDYTEVVNMMDSYINDAAYVKEEKFFLLTATS